MTTSFTVDGLHLMVGSIPQIDRMERAVIRRMLYGEHVPATEVARIFACSRRDLYRIATNEKRDDPDQDAKWLEKWVTLVTDVDAPNAIAPATSSSEREDLSSDVQEDCKTSVSDEDGDTPDDRSEFEPSEEEDEEEDEDEQGPRITHAAISSGWDLRRSARLRRREPGPGASSTLVL